MFAIAVIVKVNRLITSALKHFCTQNEFWMTPEPRKQDLCNLATTCALDTNVAEIGTNVQICGAESTGDSASGMWQSERGLSHHSFLKKNLLTTLKLINR